MGAHYRRTRKQRCIARINDLIKQTKTEYREDLTKSTFGYGGNVVKVDEFLSRIETIGYKSLLKLNWVLEREASLAATRKGLVIEKIIFEAGKQDLTAKDVLILAGQQFPGDHHALGGIDLEREMQQFFQGPWQFLYKLYSEQLEDFYIAALEPRPHPL